MFGIVNNLPNTTHGLEIKNILIAKREVMTRQRAVRQSC